MNGDFILRPPTDTALDATSARYSLRIEKFDYLTPRMHANGARLRHVTTSRMFANHRCSAPYESVHKQCFLEFQTFVAHTIRVREDGSGANARVAGDDEEMQRFVPIED